MKCKACGKDYPDTVTTCPSCGEDLANRSDAKRNFLAGTSRLLGDLASGGTLLLGLNSLLLSTAILHSHPGLEVGICLLGFLVFVLIWPLSLIGILCGVAGLKGAQSKEVKRTAWTGIVLSAFPPCVFLFLGVLMIHYRV